MSRSRSINHIRFLASYQGPGGARSRSLLEHCPIRVILLLIGGRRPFSLPASRTAYTRGVLYSLQAMFGTVDADATTLAQQQRVGAAQCVGRPHPSSTPPPLASPREHHAWCHRAPQLPRGLTVTNGV